MKILLADDTIYIRKKARQFFKDYAKITLYEASNGQEAIDCIQNQKIDLMIVDSVMPIKSGIQVVKEVKKIIPSMLIYGLTTQEKGITRKKFLEAGVKEILKKPFTNEDLYLLLKEHL